MKMSSLPDVINVGTSMVASVAVSSGLTAIASSVAAFASALTVKFIIVMLSSTQGR